MKQQSNEAKRVLDKMRRGREATSKGTWSNKAKRTRSNKATSGHEATRQNGFLRGNEATQQQSKKAKRLLVGPCCFVRLFLHVPHRAPSNKAS
jgi:hypothetical protein